MSTPKTVSGAKVTSKVPILKITINKKYNRPCVSKLDDNKLTSGITSNTDTCEIGKSDMTKPIETNLINYTQNVVAPSKATIFNLIPVVLEKSVKYTDNFMETRHTYTPKVSFTRRGDLSRDTRNQSIAERIKYLHTKAQRDCDILRIRLKALRERHKQEKEEIKKLQIYLSNLSKDKSITKVLKGQLKRKKSFISLEDMEEKECEKLLKKVRKMKQEILDLQYPAVTSKEELEQINGRNHNTNVANEKYKILLKSSISKSEVT
ncbi:uncharacterized protein LOC143260498 isoform X2 [Megalopta genalis]|uniref:uncharacterized protein LOC143260498 isoform X2 n=1 Tax=Megalopta genalis TaxID=115081 RepID=UPI003FD57C57